MKWKLLRNLWVYSTLLLATPVVAADERKVVTTADYSSQFLDGMASFNDIQTRHNPVPITFAAVHMVVYESEFGTPLPQLHPLFILPENWVWNEDNAINLVQSMFGACIAMKLAPQRVWFHLLKPGEEFDPNRVKPFIYNCAPI